MFSIVRWGSKNGKTIKKNERLGRILGVEALRPIAAKDLCTFKPKWAKTAEIRILKNPRRVSSQTICRNDLELRLLHTHPSPNPVHAWFRSEELRGQGVRVFTGQESALPELYAVERRSVLA